jgi:hypothetical protein
MKLSDEECKCPICSSGITERQFAYMDLEGQMILIDAAELAHLEEYSENKEEYLEIEVNDNKELIMVYGAVIPQAKVETNHIIPMIEKYRNFCFACLSDGKCYISTYEDILMYPEFEDVTYGHIPFVCLLRSDLPISNDMQFAFSLYLRYKDMNVLDNIFIRDFVIAVKRKEEADINIDTWKDKVNIDLLLKVSRGIV